MKITHLLLLLLGLSCSSQQTVVTNPSGLEIIEIAPNKRTAITKQNLLHLTQIYDLTPFFYTKKIHVESMVIPHSHPVLTLNTRHMDEPLRILSVFLHEEFHWWLSSRQETSSAITEIKKVFPNAPLTKTLGQDSTHLHLIVCYLEFKALNHYLGENEATKVIKGIMNEDKIYPWIYHKVLTQKLSIEKVVKKFKLLPPLLD